jgi:hypothetical protein
MPAEAHQFKVMFHSDELEHLAQSECHVPQEFIDAEVKAKWGYIVDGSTGATLHDMPFLTIIFTIPNKKEAP